MPSVVVGVGALAGMLVATRRARSDERAPRDTCAFELRAGEVCRVHVAREIELVETDPTYEPRATQIRVAQVGATKVGAHQIRIAQVRAAQHCTFQIGPRELRASQHGATPARACHLRPAEVLAGEIRLHQQRAHQVGPRASECPAADPQRMRSDHLFTCTLLQRITWEPLRHARTAAGHRDAAQEVRVASPPPPALRRAA